MPDTNPGQVSQSQTRSNGAAPTAIIPPRVLESPIQSLDKNEEAKKYYTFNETGNIMLATTVQPDQPLVDSVRKIFEEVSVFFGAMTSAITKTMNPITNQPYSLYNYNALERIIGGSGLFVHVTEEDVLHETSQVGADFSKELIQSLLGLATGAGALGFASAMVSSMGKEGIRIATSSDQSESTVGNIVFVCEYLLGMPMVSAIVIYVDCREHHEQLTAGPCIKTESHSTTWKLHKDTYFFVTPAWIRDFAKDLESVKADPNYIGLIDWLQELILKTPDIFGVFECDTDAKAGNILEPEKTYRILGQFLPEKTDKCALKFAGAGKGKIISVNWEPGEIKFSVDGSQDTAAAIQVWSDDKTVVASTPGIYTIKKQAEPPK